MRSRLIILGLLAVCAVVSAVAYTLHVQPFWRPTTVTAVACPGPSTPAYGFLAIRPRNDCTPSFTEQDVRNYVRSSFSLGHMGPIQNVTIVEILFTTSHDASILMGDSPTGLSDDAVVCYVELRGMATGTATFLPGYTATSHPASAVNVRVLFDAHSGNELGSGSQ
jgi:hypothetical protein